MELGRPNLLESLSAHLGLEWDVRKFLLDNEFSVTSLSLLPLDITVLSSLLAHCPGIGSPETFGSILRFISVCKTIVSNQLPPSAEPTRDSWQGGDSGGSSVNYPADPYWNLPAAATLDTSRTQNSDVSDVVAEFLQPEFEDPKWSEPPTQNYYSYHYCQETKDQLAENQFAEGEERRHTLDVSTTDQLLPNFSTTERLALEPFSTIPDDPETASTFHRVLYEYPKTLDSVPLPLAPVFQPVEAQQKGPDRHSHLEKPRILSMNSRKRKIPILEFLLGLLRDERCRHLVRWTEVPGEFEILNPDIVATRWAERKMKSKQGDSKPAVYHNFTRLLRRCYSKKILYKPPKRHFVYQFCDYTSWNNC